MGRKKKKKPAPRKKKHILRQLMLKAALLFTLISLLYYHLPWPVRKPVYAAVPQLDRILRHTGYTLLQGWDELALFGNDCAIQADPAWTDSRTCGGLPASPWPLRTLKNRGYTVGYSDTLLNPLWSAYRLFDVAELSSPPRPNFKTDRRSSARVSPDDYTHSGYDRGHLAPNFGIATRYGPAAQRETFLMTNIMPQSPAINRHLWKDLEHRIAGQYGRCFSEVWVVTGPVFTEPVERLESGVAIPSAYYKIVADIDRGNLRILAFLVDKNTPPFTRIRSCLTSVDEIEKRTGLNFFADLPLDRQAELEAEPAGRLWPWIIPTLRYTFVGEKR